MPPELHYNARLGQLITSISREANIKLTWGARDMLSVPILERLEKKETVDWQQVRQSIMQVLQTSVETELNPELRMTRRVDSVSVIRGFYHRFCNIPPFCSRS